MKLRAIALSALLAAPAAQAGILFTPHLSEYSVLPRGSYSDHTLVYTHIDSIYDARGNEVSLGQPFIKPGESVDAALLLLRYLWIGNLFENTGIPYLEDHDQLFRVIGNLGWQQASGEAGERPRLFGKSANASGIGDLFVLTGIYGPSHRWGPLKANTLFTVTTKFPIGDYDSDSLLNIGTNYWTFIPQLAFHADLWGRFQLDGTIAQQINGDNDEPAFGGLTPTQPADVRNYEFNLSFKLSEKWFTDFGWFRRESVGPNRFDKVDITFVDPQPALTACAAIMLPPAQCSLTDFFTLDPVPATRYDQGVESTYLSTSLYYIYRTSSVINFRVAWPIEGRGSEIPMEYDVYLGEKQPGAQPVSRLPTSLFGVQEAASVPAVPLYELRFVYLFWAP